MGFVRDGTTELGFTCDVRGCTNRGSLTPLICVPAFGHPTEAIEADKIFIFNQVCPDHKSHAQISGILDSRVKKFVTQRLAARGYKPSFERAYLMWWPSISSEYQRFLAAVGLVSPDDAQVKAPARPLVGEVN